MGRKKSTKNSKKFISTFNDIEFEVFSDSPSEEETVPDIVPYYILQAALGWNESNPPRFTKNGLKLYSYRNRLTPIKDERIERNLQYLQNRNLIEPIERGYKVTPLGVSTLEKKFGVIIVNDEVNFRKRQEYNLKLLRQLESKGKQSNQTTVTKNKKGRPRKTK